MLEKDDIRFFDISGLQPTEGIADRATVTYLWDQLAKRFPEEKFESIRVTYNNSGTYQGDFTWFDKLWGSGDPITGLPDYYEVVIHHSTGTRTEELIVWSPVAWNDRFAGTAGGGTGIGGRTYLTKPNNTQRGWTVPFAVMNGFTAATMYADNIQGWNDYTIDKETGNLNLEVYENWRLRSTHNMTIFGKAVAEILHGRPVQYAYMNGGSGGGRQSLMEVQNYPADYDGVWASCPAINWNAFLLAGFWPEVVMNEYGHFLPAAKNKYMREAAIRHCGGPEAYYHMQIDELKEKLAGYDFSDCIGQKGVTEPDAKVMREICRGPRRKWESENSDDLLWYGFLPGVTNWQMIIPIGTYYYPTPFSRRVKPFILGPLYARWITEDPKSDFSKMKFEEYVDLFEKGQKKFADNLGDDAVIDAFVQKGGKLMIDHGIDDPLIPVDGTINYYEKLRNHFKEQEKLDKFLRLYITPGDNHGNCQGNGPGITEKAGMAALIRWVEEGQAPEELRTVRVDKKKGELLEEGLARPYRPSLRQAMAADERDRHPMSEKEA